MKRTFVAAAAALALLAAPLPASADWQLKDGLGGLLTFGTVDIGGVKHPKYVQVDPLGIPLFSTANPGTIQGTVGIGGLLPGFAVTPTINIGSPGTLATAAKQDAAQLTLQSMLTALQGLGSAGSGNGGSVAVSNFPATQPVSGTVGLSGTLPSFASTPTMNIGTMPAVALSGTLPAFASTPTVNIGTLPSPVLANGSATIGSIANISGTVSLPTGAATATNQAAGNASLATIATNTAGLATAANQALLNAANGTPADPAYNGSNTATEIALLKQVLAQLPPVGSAQTVDTVVKTTAAARSLVLPVQGASDTITAGGASNVVGDVLTAVGGTNTAPFKCTVSAVNSGAVTSCAPLAGSLGSYTSLPTNPVATTSSGSGTGATLTVSYAGLAVQLAPANASRRGMHIQPQGGIAYLNGSASATPDQNSLKIAADALYETSPAFVGTGALSIIAAGAVPLPVYAREF